MPLEHGVNPAWEKKMNQVRIHITNHLFPNKKTVSESQWNLISEKFQAYEMWKSEKAGEQVESLGLERVNKILSEDLHYSTCD